MSSEVSIEDLPDEMLGEILRQLSPKDRRSALRVCKRWSALKAFGLSSVQLVIDADQLFNEKENQDYHRALLASSRRYKHLVVYISDNFQKYDLLFEILAHFSESVESLKLNFKPCERDWPRSKLIVFAKIAALSSKLKHLHINECVFESDGSDLEFSPMNDLEELYFKNHLMPLIPNMQDITPNISRLHMHIRSEESVNFLRRVSLQLVELEVWFLSEDGFLAVCAMQFPLLEKLTFVLPDDDNFDYIQSNGTIGQFLQHLPGLKGFALVDLLTYDVALQSCENIQFLCLRFHLFSLCKRLDANDFRTICTLKHLKRLQIANTLISVPDVFDFPPLPSLQMLSLDAVTIEDCFDFKRFRQHTFPSLATFELLYLNACDEDGNEGDLCEQYDVLCSDMPSMKRLGLIEPCTDLQLGPILEFCASRAPRELRISCWRVLDTPPLAELRPIPVETLIMEVRNISLEVLQNLINSMGELKRLELTFRPHDPVSLFKPYCTMHPDTIQILRGFFPRCEIVEKLRVQIKEPLW